MENTYAMVSDQAYVWLNISEFQYIFHIPIEIYICFWYFSLFHQVPFVRTFFIGALQEMFSSKPDTAPNVASGGQNVSAQKTLVIFKKHFTTDC